MKKIWKKIKKAIKFIRLSIKAKINGDNLTKDEKEFLKKRKKKREERKRDSSQYTRWGNFLRWFYGLRAKDLRINIKGSAA